MKVRAKGKAARLPVGRVRVHSRARASIFPWPTERSLRRFPQHDFVSVHPRTRLAAPTGGLRAARSEEHTSELQSLMRISYAVFCFKKKTDTKQDQTSVIIA